MTTQKKVFKTAYGVHPKQPIIFEGVGRTKQSAKDECDVNRIVRNYARTGVFEGARESQQEYGNVSLDDFQQAMNVIANGKSLFEEMPSKIRLKFENDPGQFLDFVGQEKNKEEMIELGILLKPQEVKPPEPILVKVEPPEEPPKPAE